MGKRGVVQEVATLPGRAEDTDPVHYLHSNEEQDHRNERRRQSILSVPYTPGRSAGRLTRSVGGRHASVSRFKRPSMDPLQLVAATGQTAIVVALLFVLPGLAWGPLLAPGAGSPLQAAGRAVGLSLLTTALACTGLAVFGLLRPASVVVVLVLLVVVPIAVRWQSLRGRLRSRHAANWTSSRRRWALGAGIGSIVAIVAVLVRSRLEVGPSLLPFTSTVWYYANLAARVAATGGIPATLPEWGTERAFQTDYLPVTTHTAAALQLLPGDLLVQMEVYRLALLAVAVIVAATLLRRWVSSWLAILGAVLLVATVRLDFKLLAYKPETFGLILVLFTMWLADRAMVERSRRLVATAALAAGLAFLSHAEVFLLLGPGVAGLIAARLFVAPAGGRIGLALPRPREAAAAVALGTAIVLGGLGVGALGNVAETGQLRVFGYVKATTPTPTPATPRPDEVPTGWTFTNDPTWDFYVAAVAPGQLGREAPKSFFDRRLLPRAILHVWPGLDGRSGALLVVLGGLLAVPLLAWPWLDPRRRRAIVGTWVFAVGLFVGSYLLFLISNTYVPARSGPRRLMPYELLLPVVSLVITLWGLDRLLRPGWRALLPGQRAGLAAGALLAILTVAAIVPSPDPFVDDDPDPGLTITGYDAYRWLDANLPADARVLANAYTDGSLAALAGRVGIIDGRAVYLEDRAFLAESTALVLGARVVFAEPSSPGAAAYLARERVNYLLVAGPGASGADLGGYLPFGTDLDTLRAGGRYTLVRTFGDGRLLLFKVNAVP
jgi:hypothetical protein